MNNPMNELWQAQQDAATRFADSWRKMLQPAADSATRPPTTPAADDPPAEIVDNRPADTTGADSAPEIVEPEPEPLDVFRSIQALGDGSRDFADHMTRWAELQRDLADTMTDWASRQREYADALDRMLAPFTSGSGGRPA